jgi:hypothetical protein
VRFGDIPAEPAAEHLDPDRSVDQNQACLLRGFVVRAGLSSRMAARLPSQSPSPKKGGDALYTADAQNLSESEIDGSREWRLAG